jgi:hypothetical protein
MQSCSTVFHPGLNARGSLLKWREPYDNRPDDRIPAKPGSKLIENLPLFGEFTERTAGVSRLKFRNQRQASAHFAKPTSIALNFSNTTQIQEAPLGNYVISPWLDSQPDFL